MLFRSQPGVPVQVALQTVRYRSGAEPLITVLQTVAATTDANGRATAQVPLPATAGNYRIRVSAASEGREVSDTTFVYVPSVPGGATARDADSNEQTVELVLDKASYAPGESAHVVIRGGDVDGAVLVAKEGRQITCRPFSFSGRAPVCRSVSSQWPSNPNRCPAPACRRAPRGPQPWSSGRW